MSLGLIFLASCSKDRTVKSRAVYDSVNSFFDTKKQGEQVFEITGPSDTPIVGQFGTVLYQGISIFMYPNGDSVTYPYSIGLIELYNAKEMIYYRMPSVANGEILQCAGEIRIRAFKGDTDLVLRPGASFTVYFPTDTVITNMRAFKSSGVEPINWTPTSDIATYTTGIEIPGDYYRINGKFLGWMSCAAYDNVDNTATITFSSQTDSVETISKFIYIPSYNGLAIVDGNSINMPSGLKTHFLGVGLINNDIYSFHQYFVSQTQDINITMTQTSEQDLDQLLDNMSN